MFRQQYFWAQLKAAVCYAPPNMGRKWGNSLSVCLGWHKYDHSWICTSELVVRTAFTRSAKWGEIIRVSHGWEELSLWERSAGICRGIQASKASSALATQARVALASHGSRKKSLCAPVLSQVIFALLVTAWLWLDYLWEGAVWMDALGEGTMVSGDMAGKHANKEREILKLRENAGIRTNGDTFRLEIMQTCLMVRRISFGTAFQKQWELLLLKWNNIRSRRYRLL